MLPLQKSKKDWSLLTLVLTSVGYACVPFLLYKAKVGICEILTVRWNRAADLVLMHINKWYV